MEKIILWRCFRSSTSSTSSSRCSFTSAPCSGWSSNWAGCCRCKYLCWFESMSDKDPSRVLCWKKKHLREIYELSLLYIIYVHIYFKESTQLYLSSWCKDMQVKSINLKTFCLNLSPPSWMWSLSTLSCRWQWAQLQRSRWTRRRTSSLARARHLLWSDPTSRSLLLSSSSLPSLS